LQLKYGSPGDLKQKFLCLLGDTLGLREQLGVLGFSYNPVMKIWVRQQFNPHVIDSLRSLDQNLDVSDIAAEAYKNKISFSLSRSFKPNCKLEMLLDYQKQALDFCKKSSSGVIALGIGLGKNGHRN
jgi:hypothetical protein